MAGFVPGVALFCTFWQSLGNGGWGSGIEGGQGIGARTHVFDIMRFGFSGCLDISSGFPDRCAVPIASDLGVLGAIRLAWVSSSATGNRSDADCSRYEEEDRLLAIDGCGVGLLGEGPSPVPLSRGSALSRRRALRSSTHCVGTRPRQAGASGRLRANVLRPTSRATER